MGAPTPADDKGVLMLLVQNRTFLAFLLIFFFLSSLWKSSSEKTYFMTMDRRLGPLAAWHSKVFYPETNEPYCIAFLSQGPNPGRVE